MMVSPVLMMKAQKNEIEARGMRKAHIRDAVALIDFLSLLDEEVSFISIFPTSSLRNSSFAS